MNRFARHAVQRGALAYRLQTINTINYVSSSTPTARYLHSSAPVWGVMDSLKSKYKSAFGGAEAKREQEVYETQQNFLLNRDRPLDGDTYLELLKEMKKASGMGGVKEHLPWVQSNPGLQDFKDREAVLCALTPAERSDLSSIRISTKKRVSRATGKDIEFVESMIEQVMTMKTVQDWLLRRKDAGLPIPKNGNEMRSMMSAPGSGVKRRRKGRAFQNPGLGKMAKRR